MHIMLRERYSYKLHDELWILFSDSINPIVVSGYYDSNNWGFFSIIEDRKLLCLRLFSLVVAMSKKSGYFLFFDT